MSLYKEFDTAALEAVKIATDAELGDLMMAKEKL